RRAVEAAPALWKRAAADERWRAVLSALYLAPWEEFQPENIWRDSPLTPRVLVALKEYDLLSLIVDLRNLPPDGETGMHRDAVLVLFALKEDEAIWDVLSGPDAARSWAGAIGFLSDFGLLGLTHDRGVNIGIGLVVAQTLDLKFDLGVLSLVPSLDIRSNQIILDPKRIHPFKHLNDIIRYARAHLDDDVRAVWNPGYLRILLRLEEMMSTVSQEETTFDLCAVSLQSLATALTSTDAALRRAALAALADPPPASALGVERLESLAALAAEHKDDPHLGTVLNRMLEKVKHDRPAWVQTWMEAAAQDENIPAERILNSLYTPDEAVAQTIWEALPHESKRVNRALLHALRWQAVVVPDVIASAAKQSPPLARLSAWLERESNPEIITALLN
ncbi:hypothetical protein D6833_11195, partial [Candidatus Parcubacteria bacterium]